MLTSIHLATSKDVQGQTGGYYYQCRPVTTVYNEDEHKDTDYIAKSGMRSEVSLSEKEARAMWAVASNHVGLGQGL